MTDQRHHSCVIAGAGPGHDPGSVLQLGEQHLQAQLAVASPHLATGGRPARSAGHRQSRRTRRPVMTPQLTGQLGMDGQLPQPAPASAAALGEGAVGAAAATGTKGHETGRGGRGCECWRILVVGVAGAAP